jgi:predicted dehydrogenase
MTARKLTRRGAIKAAAAGFAVPFVWRSFGYAAPSETLLHVSVGAGGMAGSDLGSLTSHKSLKLVAVADVDDKPAAAMKAKHAGIETFRDWRVMFDKVKFDSANISCPDHMHAAPTMRAIKAGKHVYTQKPLTQTIHEARQLTLAAKEAKIVSQMGIQIHSAAEHKNVVALIQAGAIGKVKAVHSVSNKDWGDNTPQPDRKDDVPANLDWNLWLGVAADRPYIGGGYYHPGNWRKRLDFGTGTFGDMGCHILDPVFGSLGVGNPSSIISLGEAPNATNWALNCEVQFTFPGSKFTTETVTITWYNGKKRPPEDVLNAILPHKLGAQGSIFIGTDGVLFSPYIGMPILCPGEKFKDYKMPGLKGTNHYHEWVDAARGIGTTSAPFSYSGPLTEMVLLGCLATRFPKKKIEWDTAKLQVTNLPEANQFVKRTPRKGWEEAGL